jgi:hypothetical protein
VTSTAKLVHACRTDLLMSGGREERNRLTSAMTTSTTSAALEFTHHLVAGDKLSVGFEDMGVWGATGQSVAVQRGDEGTDAATHEIGDIVYINARFTPGQVLRSLQAEVTTLNNTPGFYAAGYTTLTAEPHDWTYELTGIDPDTVMRVEGETTADDDEWYPVKWQVQRSAAGTFLNLPEGWDGTVRVAYRAPYTQLAADTADVAATVGVGDPTLLSVGAALRLTRGRPVRRSFTEAQGDSRRANEVAPFSTESADRNLERWYEQLKQAERARLLQMFPPRRR